MKTRQGDGTEALSKEMESNGSATPKSRRHPLTLPADVATAAPQHRFVYFQRALPAQESSTPATRLTRRPLSQETGLFSRSL